MQWKMPSPWELIPFWQRFRLTVLLLSLPLCAGCYTAVGPVFGYAFDRGGSIGWELSGGSPFFHGSVGRAYRPSQDAADRADRHIALAYDATPVDRTERITYITVEPWFIAGASLGGSISQIDPKVRLTAGVWEGMGVPIELSRGNAGRDAINYAPMGSLAVGLRWLHGAFDVYITPKIGFFAWQGYLGFQ